MSTLYAPDTATNPTTVTTAAAFIKELWSDEVVAVYKANTVMTPLIGSMPFAGQKGDTVNIPKPTRGAVTAKTAGTGVTINVETAGTWSLTIDQHFEYSRLIEDIAKIQALDSMRAFYTDDAGYAHALSLDSALHAEAAVLSAGDTTAGSAYSKAVIGGDGTTTWIQTGSGNGSALTDAGIRRAIQSLDDANVPARQRALIVPPVEKRRLMGIARFTEQAFVGEVGASNTIRNGLIGDIYGIPVYVSTNVPTVDSSDCTSYRPCLLLQKEAMVLAEQLAPRAQSQYKQEFLADLMTVDTIYGLGTPRPEAGVVLMVPAA
jgi:N4-gp56 family major capsid protein